MKRAAFVIVVCTWLAAAALAFTASIGAWTGALPQEQSPHADAITGRVVDTEGAPVAGLEVVLVPRGNLPPGATLSPVVSSERSNGFVQRTLLRQPPNAPSALRVTCDAEGRFDSGALDEHESYEMFVTPASHVVLAFPNNGVFVPSEHVELVAHALVDVTLEFASVEGAPTRGLLVQTTLDRRVAESSNHQPLGADDVVDAPRATLRLVRGRHSVEVMSWTGSNENKGIGGSAWFWSGAIEAGAKDEPLIVTLAPRHHVDAYVRNNPFERGRGLLVLSVDPAGAAESRPRFNQRQVDDSQTASVTVAGDARPHIVQLRLQQGRVLMEQTIALDRPRVAVLFDLAKVAVPPVYVRLGLPSGHSLDDLYVATNVQMATSGRLPFQVDVDGRLRFDSLALSEAVREPLARYGEPRLIFHHPRLGSVNVELQKDVFDYEAAFAPTSSLRVVFVGDGAEEVAAECVVSAGLVDPVDGFAPHHHWRPTNDERNVTRDPATRSLTIDRLQPGPWRFEFTVVPDPRESDVRDHVKLLAVCDQRLENGESVFEVRLPKRHGLSLWCPSTYARASSVVVIGEGRRVDLRTDDAGRLRVDGLFAGRYEVAVDDEGSRGRRFDVTVPCEDVVWVGRPHDALRVAIARAESPLAAAGLHDGDLVIGFDGQTFRQQKDWERVVPSRLGDQYYFDNFPGGERSIQHVAPHTALEVWSFTAARSVNLRVQRGEAVIDLAVGPIAAHTPEELEALGGTLTPVYREF